MNKYKVGDKVLIKGEIISIRSEGRDNYPYKVVVGEGADKAWFSENEILQSNKTYEDGLADAWELARKIENKLGSTILEPIFGSSRIADILDNFTPQEALAKIEAYEESKVIKVGDVVVVKSDDRQKFVVTYIFQERNKVAGVRHDGAQIEYDIDVVKKTGKHFDIEHLLEQIRGDE